MCSIYIFFSQKFYEKNTTRFFGKVNLSNQTWAIVIFWTCPMLNTSRFGELNKYPTNLAWLSYFEVSHVHRWGTTISIWQKRFCNICETNIAIYPSTLSFLKVVCIHATYTRPLLISLKLLIKCTIIKNTLTLTISLIIIIICSKDMSQCIHFVVNQFFHHKAFHT